MKLRKTPIASAIALILMSAVVPVQAQQSDTKSADAPKTQAQPDAATLAAKDKAKGTTKPSAQKEDRKSVV